MGYTTSFTGQFTITPALSPAHRAYLLAFAETRRMARNPELAEHLPDPVRVAAGLPIGPQGSYCVGGTGYAGQDRDPSITDYNRAPATQPGLWCQWVPNEAGTAVEWDGHEKFYDYTEWLEYLIEHFFQPWGYALTGDVTWQGEDDDDTGVLRCLNNTVTKGA